MEEVYADVAAHIQTWFTFCLRTSWSFVPTPISVSSILSVLQVMNADPGFIESGWRSLDVRLLYPGLCRVSHW